MVESTRFHLIWGQTQANVLYPRKEKLKQAYIKPSTIRLVLKPEQLEKLKIKSMFEIWRLLK